ncbi:ArsR/SmtB family transcription factor [Latilactobacillus graminis]|uniref:Bacterial regulatory, arsR family protein n=2 Tax=Latilactobacillus graminis TaxID=60519 RepID=A0AA89L5E7_9LACO|nr:metalloregulator ArsR/SmtB family transcription factor [Latilactobacillus graminis]KRM24432.1 bacterial regulatory, arsR family protein [Latilactobacillus graminis DSM 20719]QFP80019.1 winged helix-turn-helix transcriptional regulator [Latilactobacillus graminis]
MTTDYEQLIRSVQNTLPKEATLDHISILFKILGDKTRAKILYALFQSELRVSDIVSVLEMSQSSISHQLRALKQAKLVKNRKVGKEVYYSLADNHVINIFSQVIAHVNEH